MANVFFSGTPLVVTTHGPGRLHLLTYDSVNKLPPVVGYTQTTATGETRFLISFSYYYVKYAFFFEGAGEAVWSIGSSLQRQLVGKSWADARVATWGQGAITTANVTSFLPGATNRDNEINAFIIPAKI
jgi:hypothetical protein